MGSILPINIYDLLNLKGVESARVELKKSWSPQTTGYQVLKSICAFANDLQNLNGGYIIIGVAEDHGRPVLPLVGLDPDVLDDIQKWIRGHCNQIEPEYQPVMSPEVIDDKYILVIWVPGSDNRPHRAPDGNTPKKYFVRIGSETVDAEANGVLTDLLQLYARVPFDDRRCMEATIDDLRESRVRQFLRDVRSGLLDEPTPAEIYRKMRIVKRTNGHEQPVNVGLMFFSDEPERWFLGTRIEVVQFTSGPAGEIMEERIFRGPLHDQVRDCLSYLSNLLSSHLEKVPNQPEVKGWVSYPSMALRESLVNAVYHRGYQDSAEPIKVYLYPDRIEVISYPGPVQGINLDHLRPNGNIPPVPSRNRRIGEFLKELGLAEGRATGIPKVFKDMERNGSPAPRFDFDEGRTYFRVTLPAHPEYVAISTLRDVAHLRAIGHNRLALEQLRGAWEKQPESPALGVALIKTLAEMGDLPSAAEVYLKCQALNPIGGMGQIVTALASAYLDAGQVQDATYLLNTLPAFLPASEAIEAAILERRAKRPKRAHQYFEQVGEAIFRDVRALHEFAQTKIGLARDEYRAAGRKSSYRLAANQRLLTEAMSLLERVIQMDAPTARHAWAWYDLARVFRWLGKPQHDVRQAFNMANSLLPNEPRFQQALIEFEEKKH